MIITLCRSERMAPATVRAIEAMALCAAQALAGRAVPIPEAATLQAATELPIDRQRRQWQHGVRE